jgi:hypothetical protein
MRAIRLCCLAVLALGCAETPPRVSPTAHIDVRVPSDVLGDVTMPVDLYGRRVPGTLEHRGFLLGTICDTESDVSTEWTIPLEAETEVTVWIVPGYAHDPNTPCGITPEEYRRDRIATQPEGMPSARARVAPGDRVSLVIAPARP